MPDSPYASLPPIRRALWKSPISPLGLVMRGSKLSRIRFGADPADFPFEVERTYGTSGGEDPEAFRETQQQLEEYFAGKRLIFRLPLDMDQGTPFQRRVWKALRDIPYGQTASYKDIAGSIGQPSATRAVGTANGMNPLPVVIPCHRVVASDGTLGGFTGGLDIKKKLLKLEAETRIRARMGAATPDKRGHLRLW